MATDNAVGKQRHLHGAAPHVATPPGAHGPHGSTVQARFGSQAPFVFLDVAALGLCMAGEFDLSFASVMGLSATIILVLSGLHHVNLALS